MVRRILRGALRGALGASLVVGMLFSTSTKAGAYTYVPWNFHLNTNADITYYAVRNQIGTIAEPAIGGYVWAYNGWLQQKGSKVRLYYVYGGAPACSSIPPAYEILFCGTSGQSWAGMTETFTSSFNEYDGAHYSRSRIWIDMQDFMPGNDAYAYHLIGHELGHAFNLQHSSNPASMMYSGSESTQLDWYDLYVLGKKTEHTHCPCVIA